MLEIRQLGCGGGGCWFAQRGLVLISEWLLLDPSPNQLYVHWLIGSSHLINEYGLYVLSSFHSINAINFCGLKHYKRGP